MSDVETIENVDGRGSMYGVVDIMRQLTRALEDLLEYLPTDFVWPTIVDAQPFSGYMEWGRDDSTQPSEHAVWITASPEGVHMNASFPPGWPEVEVLDFDAETAAGWLKDLTRNWIWDARHSGGVNSSSLQRGHMTVGYNSI